jgi:hypothetical protein
MNRAIRLPQAQRKCVCESELAPGWQAPLGWCVSRGVGIDVGATLPQKKLIFKFNSRPAVHARRSVGTDVMWTSFAAAIL